VFAPPVAKNDISTTLVNVAVSNLVTLNDFTTSNVVVTITTAPSNGTAVVQPDGKTIIYTPGTGYTGVDTVGYTLTDANGQTSTAVWTITVNAVPAVSCSTVEASYSASFYPMGTFLQIAIQNLSSIGTNVLTAKNYIIEIRDVSNAILLSYSVTGSLTVDPTIFTTPVPFAANWNNVRIQQTITTQSATGAACGTVVYETPTPFLLTDVSLSWFYGTTIAPCLGILDSDTEIQKKNKLMNKICSINAQVDTNTTDISDIVDIINNLNTFVDISSSSTLYAGITGTLKVHRWRDGTIEVMVTGSYAADLTPTTKIVDNLPLSISVVQTVPAWITGVSGELGRNIAFSGITGELKAGGSTSIPVSGYGAIQIYFTYKEAV